MGLIDCLLDRLTRLHFQFHKLSRLLKSEPMTYYTIPGRSELKIDRCIVESNCKFCGRPITILRSVDLLSFWSLHLCTYGIATATKIARIAPIACTQAALADSSKHDHHGPSAIQTTYMKKYAIGEKLQIQAKTDHARLLIKFPFSQCRRAYHTAQQLTKIPCEEHRPPFAYPTTPLSRSKLSAAFIASTSSFSIFLLNVCICLCRVRSTSW
jgi:hypothetical protein